MRKRKRKPVLGGGFPEVDVFLTLTSAWSGSSL